MPRIIFRILLWVAFAMAAASAWAQKHDYPDRAVRFIVPAAPGLATDVIGRLFAEEYSKALGQPFIVENRPGAGGDIGAADVVTAAPDGYTLLFSSASVMYGNKWLYPRTFDQDKDLVPIIEVSDSPMVLLTGPAFTGKSLQEMLALAKAAPKPPAFGAASTFSAVVQGAFQEVTGVPFLMVRYNSNQQAFVELNRGDLQFMFEAIPSAQAMISSGKLTAVAVTSAKRSAGLPDVPTLKELGYDVVITGFNAIAGPRGLPPDIIKLLNRTGNEILKHPDLQKRLVEWSTDVRGGTPQDMEKSVQENSANWGRLITKFNLKN